MLFTITGRSVEDSQIAVLPLDTLEPRVIIRRGGYPRFSETGHLLYAIDGTVWAVRFDPARLEAMGDPVPVQQGVWTKPSASANFDVSSSGSLIYMPAGAAAASQMRSLVLVDRQGQEEPIGMPTRPYNVPRLSPDGQRVAVDTPNGDDEIFVFDLRTQVEERFTFDPAPDEFPLWSPDGSQIVFSSQRDVLGINNLYIKAADGRGTVARLTDASFAQGAMDWADDGETLLFGGSDFMAVQPGANEEPETLLKTPFNEALFAVSPNGRWVAYMSNEAGARQIWVRPFPDLSSGGQRLVSDGPGEDPLWGPDGRELFYLTSEAAMVVPVETGEAFQRGAPERLFSMDPYHQGNGTNWDVSPHGQRFLMVKRNNAAAEASEIVVVMNWFEELTRLVPTE